MEKKKIYIVVGILLIFGFFLVRGIVENTDIEKNKKSTVGVITEFRTHYQARYSIVYEYTVDDKLYTGHTSVSFFKCEDGKKGCVGSEFKVYYSGKNPENSNIELGKYEKYR